MNLKRKRIFFFTSTLAIVSTVLLGYAFVFSAGKLPAGEDVVLVSTKTLTSPSAGQSDAPAQRHRKPKYVRGLHLTAWVSGTPKMRDALTKIAEETEINTLVIDIKEYEGEIYIQGYDKAKEYGCFTNAIPDVEKYIAELKKKDIYLIARIVVFKDNCLPKRRPDLAVKDPTGAPWKDRAGLMWLDPYNKEARDYNIDLAEHCINIGFDEIQYDYIRFPSDGNTRNCRYSQKHSSDSASAALVTFLEESHKRLKPLGANISIDVFGLTTTSTHDMGIGQRIVEMSKWVDFVSPMVYPSHYNKGEYGIEEPNKAPYHTVYLSMEGAKRRIPPAKLRPYLQDFTMGHRYGEKEVREQIQACYDNDIAEWLLWNPRCVYTKAALKPKEFSETYEKMPLPSYITERKARKTVAISSAAVSGVSVSTAAATVEAVAVSTEALITAPLIEPTTANNNF